MSQQRNLVFGAAIALAFAAVSGTDAQAQSHGHHQSSHSKHGETAQESHPHGGRAVAVGQGSHQGLSPRGNRINPADIQGAIGNIMRHSHQPNFTHHPISGVRAPGRHGHPGSHHPIAGARAPGRHGRPPFSHHPISGVSVPDGHGHPSSHHPIAGIGVPGGHGPLPLSCSPIEEPAYIPGCREDLGSSSTEWMDDYSEGGEYEMGYRDRCSCRLLYGRGICTCGRSNLRKPIVPVLPIEDDCEDDDYEEDFVEDCIEDRFYKRPVIGGYISLYGSSKSLCRKSGRCKPIVPIVPVDDDCICKKPVVCIPFTAAGCVTKFECNRRMKTSVAIDPEGILHIDLEMRTARKHRFAAAAIIGILDGDGNLMWVTKSPTYRLSGTPYAGDNGLSLQRHWDKKIPTRFLPHIEGLVIVNSTDATQLLLALRDNRDNRRRVESFLEEAEAEVFWREEAVAGNDW